nr:hypothetical protein [Candidatus Sigynarchaeum springense]
MGEANDVLDAVYAIDTRTWTSRSIADFPRETLMRPNPVNPREKWETYRCVNVLDFSPTGEKRANSEIDLEVYDCGYPKRIAGNGFIHST